MEYNQYIKYGINNIKNQEVNVDGITDGVHTLAEYRHYYFQQMIMLAKYRVDQIVRDNLFSGTEPEKVFTIKTIIDPNYRLLFLFGSKVYSIPEDQQEDFLELLEYQEDKFKQTRPFEECLKDVPNE